MLAGNGLLETASGNLRECYSCNELDAANRFGVRLDGQYDNTSIFQLDFGYDNVEPLNEAIVTYVCIVIDCNV